MDLAVEGLTRVIAESKKMDVRHIRLPANIRAGDPKRDSNATLSKGEGKRWPRPKV